MDNRSSRCTKGFSSFSQRSLAVDTDDHPHIAYGSDHLYYAFYDGTNWNNETVDLSTSVGTYASIALDSSGKVHISYYDSTNADLKYAYAKTHSSTCMYVIVPTNNTSDTSGGEESISVSASDVCTWTTLSNASWITITSGGSGGGNGTVSYSVASNTGGSSRTGTMTIESETFTVIQAGTNPFPDIRANGFDGSITLRTSDTISINISLVAGSNLDVDCDWWVAVNTPFAPPDDWYHYDLSLNWISGLTFTYQGQLFDLVTFTVLNMTGLPAGTYTFYFAVDTNMNGLLDPGEMYYDSVVVSITQ